MTDDAAPKSELIHVAINCGHASDLGATQAEFAGPREVYERISAEVWNLRQTRGHPR